MERSKQFGSLATLVQTLLATLVLTSTPTLADKNNVIELKLSSFNSIVSKHEYALVGDLRLCRVRSTNMSEVSKSFFVSSSCVADRVLCYMVWLLSGRVPHCSIRAS